jgi:hypothetical protein
MGVRKVSAYLQMASAVVRWRNATEGVPYRAVGGRKVAERHRGRSLPSSAIVQADESCMVGEAFAQPTIFAPEQETEEVSWTVAAGF